jgi:hypothetical protein
MELKTSKTPPPEPDVHSKKIKSYKGILLNPLEAEVRDVPLFCPEYGCQTTANFRLNRKLESSILFIFTA